MNNLKQIVEELERRLAHAKESLAPIMKGYHISKNFLEYNRLVGKIEGIDLAMDYLKSLLKTYEVKE